MFPIISHPGRPITIYDVDKFTVGPYLQSFRPKNIISLSSGL